MCCWYLHHLWVIGLNLTILSEAMLVVGLKYSFPVYSVKHSLQVIQRIVGHGLSTSFQI